MYSSRAPLKKFYKAIFISHLTRHKDLLLKLSSRKKKRSSLKVLSFFLLKALDLLESFEQFSNTFQENIWLSAQCNLGQHQRMEALEHDTYLIVSLSKPSSSSLRTFSSLQDALILRSLGSARKDK